MKKFFSILCAGLVAGVAFTSCLGESDDSDNTYSIAGYYTITGSMLTGYTLHQDGGGTIIPSTSSVANVAGASGFGDHKRAMLMVQYKASMVSSDNNKITGGEIISGSYLAEKQIQSAQEAGQSGMTSADSIFSVNTFDALWSYNGWLNAGVTGRYSQVDGKNVVPSFLLVYDEDKLVADSLFLTLLYNRHSPQNAIAAGSTQTYASFPLDDMRDVVPGSKDSVVVVVRCKECPDKKIRIARADMRALR